MYELLTGLPPNYSEKRDKMYADIREKVVEIHGVS